jgi:putative acetyltransferase
VSNDLEIRVEEPGDREAVRRVNEAAFETATEADLVDALRDGGDAVPELCLVAVEGGEVVGHICFSRARLVEGAGAGAGAGAEPEILALAPMAVLPARQNDGIGSELVREGLLRAEETRFPLVVVLGHPDYYPRFGFDPASAYGVACPYEGVPPEAWMAYTLPSYEPGTSGTVAYAPPFGA